MLRALLLTLIFLSSSAFGLDYQEIKNSYYRSYLYERSGNYEDAIKALMPVYKSFPNGYTVNLRLGWLYYLVKKYANSEFHYKKALQAVPSSVEAMLGLTLPYIAQGKWSDTEALCYRILRIDYYNYYGNLRLSYALRMEGKYSIAEAVNRKMLSIYPADVNFLLELALSLYNQGKTAYAKSLFEDILILDPENTVAKEYLNRFKNEAEAGTGRGESKKRKRN
ncbi:tetratricopeptide repeat protein [Thermovibrio sp.]